MSALMTGVSYILQQSFESFGDQKILDQHIALWSMNHVYRSDHVTEGEKTLLDKKYWLTESSECPITCFVIQRKGTGYYHYYYYFFTIFYTVKNSK